MSKQQNVAKNPVTPDAREAFMLYMQEWQERLGLVDWRISLDAKPAARANMAEVASLDYESRIAVVRLGEDFGTVAVDDLSLEQIAAHEVFHILLKPLITCASDPKCPDDVTNSEEHRVIHILVRLLVGKGH